MELSWKGPYVVTAKKGLYDYEIDVGGGKLKTYHINMLKRYLSPNEDKTAVPNIKVSRCGLCYRGRNSSRRIGFE